MVIYRYIKAGSLDAKCGMDFNVEVFDDLQFRHDGIVAFVVTDFCGDTGHPLSDHNQ